MEGDDLITDVPTSHWNVDDHYDPDPTAKDRTYGRRGAFLPYVDFDPTRYGISPNTLTSTDSAQLLSLVVAERVLDDVRSNSTVELDRERVGVVIGTGALDLQRTMSNRMQRPVWLSALREGGVPEVDAQAICDRIADHYVPWQEATFPGLLSNVVAGRIANCFDLHGTNMTVDAACASSLAAVSIAVGELSTGLADMVIAGGVDTFNDILAYMCFSKTPALSMTEDCRPFSEAADGTMLGEAIVLFALKRLSDAEADGDRIYAVVRGVGSSSDGRGSAIYAPVPAGQSRALHRAYRSAGYGPNTVELVEGHGTGTKAGDAAEFSALRSVFESSGRTDAQWCALGSAKSQFGHTKSAAGAVGMLKAVLALNNKVLPPTIKVDRPSPALELSDGPLYLNTEARPWIKAPGETRRASVSSFGFGGSNFHVTMEEYVAKEGTRSRATPSTRINPTELVLLSARTSEELLDSVDELKRSPQDLPVSAYLSQQSYDAHAPHRLSIVATDAAHLSRQLERVRSLVNVAENTTVVTPDGMCYSSKSVADVGATAWVFPGQGAQYPGMGGSLAMTSSSAREAWDDASSLQLGDQPLHRVVHPVPVFSNEERSAAEELLTRTEWAQPALAVHSLALVRVLESLGLAPDCVAGHSFGEVVALRVAGVIDDVGLVRLARARGEAMRDASSETGAMLSVAMSRTGAQHAVEECGLDGIAIANHNGPRQVTLAGDLQSIEIMEKQLVGDGVPVHRLAVSAAFHSPALHAAVAPLAEFLDRLPMSPPEIDVYANDGGAVYGTDLDATRARITRHLVTTVNFVDEIEAMYAAGVRTFVEVGAGGSVTGMIDRILEGREHLAVGLDRQGRHGMTSLQEGVGRLAVEGVVMQFDSWWDSAPVDDSSVPAPRMSVPINGANRTPTRPAEDESTTPVAPPHPLDAERELMPFRPVTATHTRPASVISDTQSPDVPATSFTDDWLTAFREAQAQTAEAHSVFTQAMADTHRAYLSTVEAAFTGGDRGDVAVRPPVRAAVLSSAVPPASSADEPRMDILSGKPPVSGSTDAAVRATESAAPVVAVSDVPSDDVAAVLMDVIAEKTGFPVEVIGSEMELAADLGIDSIKRVEILAELRKRLPGLASVDVDVSQLAELTTVDRISDRFRSMMGSSVPDRAPVVAVSDVPSDDVAAVLMDVIAEKTGFPVEVIGSEMELAADLGIDSIKRVEILAELRKRLPGLASVDVDVSQLAELTTVDRISERFRSMMGSSGTGDEPPDMNDELGVPEVAELTRSASIMTPASRPGLELPHLRHGTIAVTDDGAGVAECVVIALREHGIDAFVGVEAARAASRGVIGGLVSLDCLRPVDTVDDALGLNFRVFDVVRGVVADLARTSGSIVIVQDTGGDFGLSGKSGIRAWSGGGAGLARTVDKELPTTFAKVLDIEVGSRLPGVVASDIVAELLNGGAQRDVGLAASGPRSVLTNVATGTVRGVDVSNEKNQVVVATGGARGVTARSVTALAARFVARGAGSVSVVLLGRTELEEEPPGLTDALDQYELRRALSSRAARDDSELGPAAIAADASRILANREIRATLLSAEAAGIHAEYLSVDVRERDALTDALMEIRHRLGPVTAVVHGAGVLADRHIAHKSNEQFEAVLGTKVGGLRNLLEATADDPLDLVVIFSSATARFGNSGQSDYAMANEVTAQVAATVGAARPECIVRSIDWGPWDGGMVTPELRERFRSSGIGLVPLDSGAHAMADELDRGPGPMRVSISAVCEDEQTTPADDTEVVGVIHVDSTTHPFLADHAPAGIPVVPLTLALEWIVGAARVFEPSASILTVRDVQVIRGIVLEEFDGAGHDIEVLATRSAEGIRVMLRSEESGPQYEGVVGFEPSRIGEWVGKEEYDSGRTDAYSSRALFHGNAFHSIDAVTRVDDAGASAKVSGTDVNQWRSFTPHTDTVALDAGLQLALLWAECVTDASFLPMSVSSVTVVMNAVLGSGATAMVRAGDIDALTARCDVAIRDSAGTIVAEFLGLGLVRRTDVDDDDDRLSAAAGHHAD